MAVEDGGQHEGFVEELADALFVGGDANDAVLSKGASAFKPKCQQGDIGSEWQDSPSESSLMD